MTDHLEVGRISRAHGLRGEVLVILSTDRLERVEPGSVLYNRDQPLEVVSSRPHQNGWLVQFNELRSRDAAEAARGRPLTAPPLDDDDVLWVHELVGAQVIEVDGTVRGVVEAVEVNPASDLLVLDTGALVPLVFVVEQESGQVTIDPPDGLFDVQA